jgi:hypothetical protein
LYSSLPPAALDFSACMKAQFPKTIKNVGVA